MKIAGYEWMPQSIVISNFRRPYPGDDEILKRSMHFPDF
jgi:hypothetical protein